MKTGEYLEEGMEAVGVTVSILGPGAGEVTCVCTIGFIAICLFFLVNFRWNGGFLAITFLFVVLWDVVGSSNESTL